MINAGESSMASKYSVSSSSSLASSLSGLSLPSFRTYGFVSAYRRHTVLAEASHVGEFVIYRPQGESSV